MTSPASPDIIFVSGRQNSGNTMLAFVFANVPRCFSNHDEDTLFDNAQVIDRIRNPDKRVAAVIEQLRLHDPPEHQAITEQLLAWQRENPEARALGLYSQAVLQRLQFHRRDFCVQKATSYIFYAQTIFDVMPGSRMLYMLRNPYDLCTSRKQRSPSLDRLFGIAFGWNRGISLAHHLQSKYPDRFRIVRYEDVVTKPEHAVREVFEFLRVPFDAKYLDIPHVNPAEARFDQSKMIQHDKRGLTSGRVYRYTQHLSKTEIAAVDMLVSSKVLSQYYPDLPHRRGKHSMGIKLIALLRVMLSPLHYIVDRFRLFGNKPLLLISRTWHRIRTISGRPK